ncbi:hypothetical protein WJX73_007536 [Symbiochloris irregularis]|uniref:DNA repair protein UVH3 n=1 Tax=Symbiochloris irregularis TaxID=706552 RepID=A0AAW1PE26_9CHLO
MGVQGLWVLLEPVGRRVNIEALTNKRLAVDASIWLHQFLKAMRDEKGEVLKNAHLLGFFRRICRLLFHRVRPVFVFDGATPALKRRTTIARRRQREQQTANLRKTAEKLLLAQLKRHALNHLSAQPTDAQISQHLRQHPEAVDATAQRLVEDDEAAAAVAAAPSASTAGDELLAAQLNASGDYGDASDQEVKMLADLPPEAADQLDPAVLSTLPPSLQLELMGKLRESKTYRNREEFASRTGNPLGFSTFQMQQYLDTSAVRRKMDRLKDEMNAKAMAGKGGVQAHRIAAQPDREYILTKDDAGKDGPQEPGSARKGSQSASGEVPVELSLSLPAGTSVDDLFKAPSAEAAAADSAGDDEDWEDVEGSELQLPQKGSSGGSAGLGKVPQDWRERMKQQQKYWSTSHGFQFGRKLADWGKKDGREQLPSGSLEAGGSGSMPQRGDFEEDEQLQEAIRLSLQHSGSAGAAKGNGGISIDIDDEDEDDIPEPIPEIVEKGKAPMQGAATPSAARPPLHSSRSKPQALPPSGAQAAASIADSTNAEEQSLQMPSASEHSDIEEEDEPEVVRMDAEAQPSQQPSASAAEELPEATSTADDGNDRQNGAQEDSFKDDKQLPAGPSGESGQEQVPPHIPVPVVSKQDQAPRPAAIPAPSISSFDMEGELASLENETKALQSQHRKQAGSIDTPTAEMFGECQELLQMFGLPYIIAPMEAEAQCAWLNDNGLVDGVVTDDNDVFLFGGRHVYRHIFEDKRYVEEYRVEDVEGELGLDRNALIRMALLLGSDYTEGVPGVGIVNALEIVRAFPTDEDLRSFRDWVNIPDAEALAAAQGKAKEPAKEGDEQDQGKEFKRKHRSARRGWQMPDGFPNSVIVEAYTTPRVDESKEKFTHARPDLQLLRTFCRDKFGWTPDKVDQLLLPVLKAYEERQTQLTMDAFLTFSQRFAKVKSSRLQKALAQGKGAAGKRNIEALSLAGEGSEATPKPKKPRKQRQSKKAKAQAEAEAEAEAQLAEPKDSETLSQEEQLQQGTGVFSPGSGSADDAGWDFDADETATAAEKPARGKGSRGGRKKASQGTDSIVIHCLSISANSLLH